MTEPSASSNQILQIIIQVDKAPQPDLVLWWEHSFFKQFFNHHKQSTARDIIDVLCSGTSNVNKFWMYEYSVACSRAILRSESYWCTTN